MNEFSRQSPDVVYKELFDATQRYFGLGKSKIFVDAIPKRDPQEILGDFQRMIRNEDFSLEVFIKENFHLPDEINGKHAFPEGSSIHDYLKATWGLLERQEDNLDGTGSLVGLPNPYIVPGGRFREIYYWDSFFTMLGLVHSDKDYLIKNMVDNFAYLVETVGFIPNGNRTYYCSRSQPPFFVLMVELLADLEQDRHGVLQRYLPYLRSEYDFWMSGSRDLENIGDALRRVVKVEDGFLNRFWEESTSPRPEGYLEDIELVSSSDRDQQEFYQNIRAACESGWDFSARWFEDYESLETINTTNILPVDLNCLMVRMEQVLSDAYGYSGDEGLQAEFTSRANVRSGLIRKYFYNSEDGFFVDIALDDFHHRSALTLAGVFPLYFKIATDDQARAVSERLESDFLKEGGWLNSLYYSGEQWDAPNGWAPSQWMVYSGLKEYGFEQHAKEGGKRWIANNLKTFESSGVLYEKYDVDTVGESARGGEYEVQDGFGWTNGVLVALMKDLNLEARPFPSL